MPPSVYTVNKFILCGRSYRIRHNTGQVRTDRFATYGAVLGTGASVVMGSGALPGLLAGITAATFSAGIYNNAIAKKS